MPGLEGVVGFGPDHTRQLVARRKELGLRQEDLALLAGVSERFVRQLEAGKQTVRLDTLTAVLDALGLELALVRREVRG